MMTEPSSLQSTKETRTWLLHIPDLVAQQLDCISDAPDIARPIVKQRNLVRSVQTCDTSETLPFT